MARTLLASLVLLVLALAACGDSTTGTDLGQDLAGNDAGVDLGSGDAGAVDMGHDSGLAPCPRSCPDGQNVVRWALADGGSGCQCDPSPCGPGDAGLPFCVCASPSTACTPHGVSCGTCDDVRSSIDCSPC